MVLSKAYQCRGIKYPNGSYGYEKKKKSLHAACWKLVSEIVRKGAVIKYGVVKCYTCEKKFHYKDMDCGHFEHGGTSNLSLLDFCFDNLRPQCRHCNKYLRGNLGVYRQRLEDEIGPERMAKIMEIKRQINKMSHEDYAKLKKELKIRLMKLEAKMQGRL